MLVSLFISKPNTPLLTYITWRTVVDRQPSTRLPSHTLYMTDANDFWHSLTLITVDNIVIIFSAAQRPLTSRAHCMHHSSFVLFLEKLGWHMFRWHAVCEASCLLGAFIRCATEETFATPDHCRVAAVALISPLNNAINLGWLARVVSRSKNKTE